MDPHYELTVVVHGGSAEVSGSSFTVASTASLEALDAADTVIVPGYADFDAELPIDVLDALSAAHRNGARMVSICSGVFALAGGRFARRTSGDNPLGCLRPAPQPLPEH
jgi:transcriptional regulator GlxA family with amidase domain